MEALPGSDEPFFILRRYKEIDNLYSRITLYLCPCSDYLNCIWDDDSNSDSDINESDHEASAGSITILSVPDEDQIKNVKPVPCLHN